jgi:hypothetical protein
MGFEPILYFVDEENRRVLGGCPMQAGDEETTRSGPQGAHRYAAPVM